jgi:hypothetical protein
MGRLAKFWTAKLTIKIASLETKDFFKTSFVPVKHCIEPVKLFRWLTIVSDL